MGHKVSPLSFRLPIYHNWTSKWYTDRNFSNNLIEDINIRRLISKKLGSISAVEKIEIERNREIVNVKIFSARPGVIIGRSGQGINDLKSFLEKGLVKIPALRKNVKNSRQKIKLEIIEVKVPELSASLVAANIASQISRRIAYRRASKQAIEKTITKGAKGIKVSVGGRLGGAEIARTEKFGEGTVPLGSLRADIDYALVHAKTTYGVIGVKVWIYKGEKKEEE